MNLEDFLFESLPISDHDRLAALLQVPAIKEQALRLNYGHEDGANMAVRYLQVQLHSEPKRTKYADAPLAPVRAAEHLQKHGEWLRRDDFPGGLKWALDAAYKSKLIIKKKVPSPNGRQMFVMWGLPEWVGKQEDAA